MITKFGSLYAGHVDLGDIGLGATALNDRRFDNDHLITIFDRVEKMVKVMDDLGYHSFWAAEHHFQREGYEVFPNLILLGVHLAGLTNQLKFGQAFNVVPMWHPIRLAEETALLDHLSRLTRRSKQPAPVGLCLRAVPDWRLRRLKCAIFFSRSSGCLLQPQNLPRQQ